MSKCGRALVRSRSLKVLSTCGSFDELFVEDAPNLEVLLGDAMYMRPVHLKVAHAPKLEFLGYLGMSFRAIQIVDSILEKDKFLVRTLMPSLKTLAVEVSYTTEGYIGWLLHLLTLFPCLETLYIKSDIWSKVCRRTGIVGGGGIHSSLRRQPPREGGVPGLPRPRVADRDGQVPSREEQVPQGHGVPLHGRYCQSKLRQAPKRIMGQEAAGAPVRRRTGLGRCPFPLLQGPAGG